MFDSLVAELAFEIDRHNLRVTVAQTRKAQLDEMAYLQRIKDYEKKGWCVKDMVTFCDCKLCNGCDDHEVMMEELETTHSYYRYLKDKKGGDNSG